MAECCIVGCFNRPTKGRELKFYSLPTATSTRPFKVKRRQLWLEAIEKANGSTAGLSPAAQVCSAHFVSGQVSLEISNQDFVPSVFPNKQKPKSSEGTRRESLRPRIHPTEAPIVSPKKKAQRKQNKAREQLRQSTNIVLTENDYCEPLEDEEVLEEKEKIQLSSEVIPTEFSQYKKPRLLLKSIVDPLGRFQCDVCNGKFSSGSALLKHKQLHDQEWSDEETLPTVSADCEKSDLTRTNKQIHEKEPSFKCNMCDRSFPTTHNLKRHKLLHVRDARKCMQCGTLFCKRHNHVVVQPQISTETTFEEDTATDDCMNVSTESQIPETLKSEKENDDDDTLEMLLNSDSQTFETTSAEQEQSETLTDAQSKPVPAVTCNPRKPDLLTAFTSFLTKRKVNLNTTTAQPVTSTQSVESTSPTPSSSTDVSATQPVPEPSSKVETSTSTSTPQPGKPVLIIQSSKPQPGQLNQKIEQSTVCLSFSKPLPSHVLKEFMSFISKNECSKSTVPRLITFTAKPAPAIQEPATNQISTILKVEPATDPIALPILPKPQSTAGLVAAPQKQETLYVISTHPEPGPSLKLISPPSKPASSSTVSKPASSSTVSSVTSASPAKTTLTTPKKHPPLKDEYVHSSRPPSPVPILAKKQRGPWDSASPNYPKDFVQPHLPQTPVLPPTLQMFSSQYLTSAMLDVKRNYEYILSKSA